MVDNAAAVIGIELLAAAQGIDFHRPARSAGLEGVHAGHSRRGTILCGRSVLFAGHPSRAVLGQSRTLLRARKAGSRPRGPGACLTNDRRSEGDPDRAGFCDRFPRIADALCKGNDRRKMPSWGGRSRRALVRQAPRPDVPAATEDSHLSQPVFEIFCRAIHRS